MDSWTEGDDVFCLVNRHPEHYDGTLGLHRVVEDDWTIDGVVDQVLVGELGEPLGSMEDTLHRRCARSDVVERRPARMTGAPR